MEANQTLDESLPTEEDKAFYQLLGYAHGVSRILKAIKTLSTIHKRNASVGKMLARIERSSLDLHHALRDFQDAYMRTKPGQSDLANIDTVATTVQRLHELAVTTPAFDFSRLVEFVGIFEMGNYREGDNRLFEAINDMPDDFSAQTYMLVRQYVPDLDEIRAESFALAIEQLLHIRQNYTRS